MGKIQKHKKEELILLMLFFRTLNEDSLYYFKNKKIGRLR